MKVISINAWGGRMTRELMDLMKKNADVDVFCFQEVYHEAHGKDLIWKDGSNFDFLNDLKKEFPEHTFYYRPHLDDWWGLAMAVKKGVSVVEEGEVYVHKFKGHNPELEPHGHTAKNIQYLKVQLGGNKAVTIMNIHGLWNGGGKTDTEDRLNQSKNIVKFIKSLEGEYVICGDFNLEPSTESLQMIARELGCRDLIKEYGVTSTRTHKYTKPVKFADYAFVSKGLDLLDFKVLPDVVSDHSPLFLEFN